MVETLRKLTPDQLARLNSMTKYPSIPTYHGLGEKGVLKPTLNVPTGLRWTVQEKIDGTNVRILSLGADYIIGMREELLTASGDLIYPRTMGIVDTVRQPAACMFSQKVAGKRDLYVIYGEVYGAGVGKAAKVYADEKQVGFRVFDLAIFPEEQWQIMLRWAPDEIAAWRDAGNTPWADAGQLALVARYLRGAQVVPTVEVEAEFPETIPGVHTWLASHMAVTRASLVGTPGIGRPEGVILRSDDRRHIAKARFEDYERTVRQTKKEAKV